MSKNTLNLDTKFFDDYIEKLESVGADIRAVLTDALEQSAETVEMDTLEAMKKANLPAKGKYSRGDTKKSIVRNSKVKWAGYIGSIDVGFDYGKDGAGGYLITGTPRMKPNYELEKIYKRKAYMTEIKKDMIDIFNDAISEKMGGE